MNFIQQWSHVLDKLKKLEIFVKVVDSGSFTAAANAFGKSPSTVSKAVLKLESEVGVKLLDRNTRQLKLTDGGEQYFETASLIIKRLSECEEKLVETNEAPAGKLRLNVPIVYGRLYVTPFLTEFKRNYPDIDLEVTFTDRHENIIENGYDLSIRTGQVAESRLIAKQMSPIEFLICGSPKLFEQQRIPCNYGELAELPWIFYRFCQTGKIMPISLDIENTLKIENRPSFIVDDGIAMAELCAQGHGLIQAPHFLVKDYIKDGKLKVLSPGMKKPGFGVYMNFSKNERMPIKTRVFIDSFQEYLKENGEEPYKTWVDSLIPLSDSLG